MMNACFSFLAIAVASAALAGCGTKSTCNDEPIHDEYCFEWPVPEDGGTSADPGPCPAATNDDAAGFILSFGKNASGDRIQQGAKVLGAGAVKQGQCCYQVETYGYCE